MPPEKPILRSEPEARKAADAWRGKPAHTSPPPGAEDRTRSDDYEDRTHHHLPAPAPITDDPAEI